jgi:hypothetical protein
VNTTKKYDHTIITVGHSAQPYQHVPRELATWGGEQAKAVWQKILKSQ